MKCSNCKKKSHLEFACVCDKTFCVSCRTPEVHHCAVYVPAKVVLEKVVEPKVDKI